MTDYPVKPGDRLKNVFGPMSTIGEAVDYRSHDHYVESITVGELPGVGGHYLVAVVKVRYPDSEPYDIILPLHMMESFAKEPGHD